MKDVKSTAQATSTIEEKYRFKLSSLEKTNDFLKLKVQDSEKKVAHEQEISNGLSKKLEKLQQKLSLAEKSQKETQERNIHEEPVQSSNEKPLDIIDLNNSQNQAKPEENEESKNFKQQFAEPEAKNIGKGKVITFDNSPNVAKKKVLTKPSTSEDTKVLLNLIHNLVIPLKFNLSNALTQNPKAFFEHGRHSKSLDEKNDEVEGIFDIESGFDIGKIFYPSFNNLIGNITELLPMLGKPYNVKHIFTIVDLYYKLLSFFFRFHMPGNKILSEMEIQNSINKSKNSIFFLI